MFFNEGFSEYQDSLRELPIQRRVCFELGPTTGPWGSGPVPVAPGSSSTPLGSSGSVYTGSPNDYAAYAAWEASQMGQNSFGGLGVPGSQSQLGVGNTGLLPPSGSLPGGWMSPSDIASYDSSRSNVNSGLGERESSLDSLGEAPPSSSLGSFIPPSFEKGPGSSFNPFSGLQEGFSNWWSGLSKEGGLLYIPPGGSSTPGYNTYGEPVGGFRAFQMAAESLPGLGGVNISGIFGLGPSAFSGSIHRAPNFTLPFGSFATSLGIGSGAVATIGALGYALDQARAGNIPSTPFIGWLSRSLPNLGGPEVPGVITNSSGKGLMAPTSLGSIVPMAGLSASAGENYSIKNPPPEGSVVTRPITLGGITVVETLTSNKDGSITSEAPGRSKITYVPSDPGRYMAAVLAFRPTTGVYSGTKGSIQKTITSDSSSSSSPSSSKPDSSNNYGGMRTIKPSIDSSLGRGNLLSRDIIDSSGKSTKVYEPKGGWSSLEPKFGESVISTRELGFRQSADGSWFSPTTTKQFYDDKWLFDHGFLTNIDGTLLPNPSMVNTPMGRSLYNAGILQAWGGMGPIYVLPNPLNAQGIDRNAFSEFNNFLSRDYVQKGILGDKYVKAGDTVTGYRNPITESEAQSINRSSVDEIRAGNEVIQADRSWLDRKAWIPSAPRATIGNLTGDPSNVVPAPGASPLNRPSSTLWTSVDPYDNKRVLSTFGYSMLDAGMRSTPNSIDYGQYPHYHTESELGSIKSLGGEQAYLNPTIFGINSIPLYGPRGQLNPDGTPKPTMDRDGTHLYETGTPNVYTTSPSGVLGSGGPPSFYTPQSCPICNVGQKSLVTPIPTKAPKVDFLTGPTSSLDSGFRFSVLGETSSPSRASFRGLRSPSTSSVLTRSRFTNPINSASFGGYKNISIG